MLDCNFFTSSQLYKHNYKITSMKELYLLFANSLNDINFCEKSLSGFSAQNQNRLFTPIRKQG